MWEQWRSSVGKKEREKERHVCLTFPEARLINTISSSHFQTLRRKIKFIP